MSQPNPLCVGIDVSKASLDISVSSGAEVFTVSNDIDGFDAILFALKQHTVSLLLMEATGGLEAAVACALQAEGFDVVVINYCSRQLLRRTGRAELPHPAPDKSVSPHIFSEN
ncbi:IS110 family transposase [Xenorhabdus budapestensis]|uniref:IS110 family transposase n=1 Tax=Xenorhabdus budapestensis TaxID=290110 RepID=A0A2D0IU96_XENBU|nr:transposase [Xenorhabdus budapestensis]PHM25440.1 IS110 family transposase [Xenorhabdus budapestensis]